MACIERLAQLVGVDIKEGDLVLVLVRIRDEVAFDAGTEAATIGLSSSVRG